MSNIEDRVKAVIADELGVAAEHITSEKSIKDDLGADSLDSIELTMFLEDEFGIEIPDEDAEKIKTVQDAIDYVYKKVPV